MGTWSLLGRFKKYPITQSMYSCIGQRWVSKGSMAVLMEVSDRTLMRRVREGAMRRYWIRGTSIFRFLVDDLDEFKKDRLCRLGVAEKQTISISMDNNSYGKWLTREQAAKYVDCSTKTIDRLRKRKLLRRTKLKGMRIWRFKREDLDDLFFDS